MPSLTSDIVRERDLTLDLDLESEMRLGSSSVEEMLLLLLLSLLSGSTGRSCFSSSNTQRCSCVGFSMMGYLINSNTR